MICSLFHQHCAVQHMQSYQYDMGIHYNIPVDQEQNLKWVTGFRGDTEFCAVANPKVFKRSDYGKEMEKEVQESEE